jgi:hypothetical protein
MKDRSPTMLDSPGCLLLGDIFGVRAVILHEAEIASNDPVQIREEFGDCLLDRILCIFCCR